MLKTVFSRKYTRYRVKDLRDRINASEKRLLYGTAEILFLAIYSEIDDVRDLIKINEEIEEFLYYLANNEKLPKYITNKADDLWRQI